MDHNIKSLYDFIDLAQKNRKYLPNVATNFRTPLRLIEQELSDEEKGSIKLIKEHLEEVFNLIYSRSTNKLSASSLETYKKRIRILINDYEKYGKDASKMASWNRIAPIKKKKENKISKEEKGYIHHPETVLPTSTAVEVGEFRLILPTDWDMNKTRQAIVKGEFSIIYDELTKLSSKLKKEEVGEG